MPEFLSLFAVAGLAAIAALAYREHVALRHSRRGLLTACQPVVDAATLSHGGDDFPRLDGRRHGRRIRAELVPDSMTIRRLPQLWLVVTRLQPQPRIAEFAILVRPSGTEFYSLTSDLTHNLTPPPALPREVLIRGGSPDAQSLINAIERDLARILANPKVKEVAMTRQGARIVWQAGEGRRGEHLLLRQCVFDDAAVDAATLARLIRELEFLNDAVAEAIETSVT